MANLTKFSTAELRRLIDETEQSLQELREELQLRQEDKQHQEVERLDEYMKHAELSLTSIRDFVTNLVSEMRS